MYENELKAAISAAEAAASVIKTHYKAKIVAESKIGADHFAEPVTAADRESSRIIVEALGAAFPADFILSEEEPDQPEKRIANSRVWITDPIDGTSGFINRTGDFAVQIGLAVDGEPVVGVVLLPFFDTLYFAAKGSGAFVQKSGQQKIRLQTSDTAEFGQIDIAVSRMHKNPKMNDLIKFLGIRSKVERGSVGLKIGLISEQICGLYIHLSGRTKLWDTCGPHVVINESGGKLTDLFGEEIRYDVADVQNHNGLIASNGAIHDSTVAAMRSILNKIGRFKVLVR